MPDISIKDQLKKLVELQTIDSQIYRHKKDLTEKPAHIEELRKKYEDKKAMLNELEERVKGIQVKRKERELELASKEEDTVKANAQLSQLKTNKEYQAKITEIENIKADISLIEEQILKLFDETDSVGTEIEKEKKFLAQEEKQYLQEKKTVEEEIKVIEDKVRVLDAQRTQVIENIDSGILARYERILAGKDGLAMVPVKDDACSGCFMNVPAQVVNEIKMHDKVIYCEMCSRILYLEDDL